MGSGSGPHERQVIGRRKQLGLCVRLAVCANPLDPRCHGSEGHAAVYGFWLDFNSNQKLVLIA